MAGPEQQSISLLERVALPLHIETFFYALYVLLITYLLIRPWAARRTVALPLVIVISTSIMFVIFSLYWALDVYLLSAKFRYLRTFPLVDAPDIRIQQGTWRGVPTTRGLPPEAFPLLYVQWISQLALLVLGDYVSLWRAYVVFEKPRWLYASFVSTAAIESAIFVLLFITTSPAYFPTSPAFARVSDKARVPLTFIGYSTTGAAQLTSTSLIAYKAWKHWKDVRTIIKSRGVAAMTVAAESGIVYFALLAQYGFTSFFGPKNGNWSVAVLSSFYSVPLIAMYPTLLVVLVASRRTVLEEASVGSLHFASNERESTSHAVSDVAHPVLSPARISSDEAESDVERGSYTAAYDAIAEPGDAELARAEKGLTSRPPPSHSR
ncbi:unnamed protein product [Peniophora sp. CBMAI 1063]|nr:unnamed protein product [Peniophora sp. CBMAI 1063]